MLKLFVMIECDICNESFKPVALSCDRNQNAWLLLATEIEMQAESFGWNIHGKAFLCTDCVQDKPNTPTE